MTGAVLLRAVADVEAPEQCQAMLLDAPSEVAIGQAVQWRRSSGAGLTGIAVGPARWERAIRYALALGLDGVRQVATPDGSDSDIAWTAAAVVRALPPDAKLVFAGAAASDGGSGALPAAVAGILDWPLLSGVVEARDLGAATQVEVRSGPGLRRSIEVTGNAVLAAAQLPAPSVYPPLARRLGAARASIDCLDPSSYEVMPVPGRLRFAGYGPGRPRTKHLVKPNPKVSAGARLNQLMAGGSRQRSATQAEGDSRDLARQLVELLQRAGLFS